MSRAQASSSAARAPPSAAPLGTLLSDGDPRASPARSTNASVASSVWRVTPAGENTRSGLIRFQNNVMLYNHADDGGVIYISNSTHIELVNNLIYGNWADDYGAAVWLRNQTRDDLVFARNTVVGNDAVRAAGLVTLSGDGANINSSLIAENTPNNIANDWPQSFTLVTDYAPLVDPAAGDFRLVGGSSAIDGGDPSWFDDDGTRADQGVDLALLPMDLLE